MPKALEKYIAGNYTREDLHDVIDFLNEAQSSLQTNAELSKTMLTHWKNCDTDETAGNKERFDQLLHAIHHKINLTSEREPLLRRIYAGYSRIAAILILPALLALGIYQAIDKDNTHVASTTVSVPYGAISQMVLPDGTHVWLNSGSKLTYPISFAHQSNRIVELHGEGFFHVTKNKQLPFIVKTSSLDIKVTGTQFNARAYDDEKHATVALVEGSVELGNMMQGKFNKIGNLIPNQVAVLDKHQRQLEISRKVDLDKYTAWREGRIVFDDDPLETVVDKFEKLFNVNVVIKSPELYNYRFTATFVNETLERALKILSLSSPISYQIIKGQRKTNGTIGKRTIVLKKIESSKHSM